MAATPSVRVVKSSNFKGGARNFSNRYHFNGGTPADATHWHTLFDAIVAVEKTVYDSAITIVECLGYAAGSDVPVATKTYAVAGTLSPGIHDARTPLECAALIRWSTNARSVKNHPIYCFSYIHGCLVDTTGASGDVLVSDQKTALSTYASDWITGFSDGSITAVRATPNGAAAVGSLVEEYVTHRDFPYSTSV
jgi:hypothetical protein